MAIRIRGKHVELDIRPGKLAERHPALRALRERLIERSRDPEGVDRYLTARLAKALESFGERYVAEMALRIEMVFSKREELASAFQSVLDGKIPESGRVAKVMRDIDAEFEGLKSPKQHLENTPKVDLPPAEPVRGKPPTKAEVEAAGAVNTTPEVLRGLDKETRSAVTSAADKFPMEVQRAAGVDKVQMPDALADLEVKLRAAGESPKSVARIIDGLERINRENRKTLPKISEPEAERAFYGASTPAAKGGKQPTIADRRVPTKKRDRMDMDDIELLPEERGMKHPQRAAVDRVQRVIGKRIDETPLKGPWERMRTKLLDGRDPNKLSKDTMLKLYKQAQKLFWDEVRKDDAAKKFLAENGFEVPESGAAMLKVKSASERLGEGRPEISAGERRISLDHALEKAIGENYKRALDADNLNFEFHFPNSFREIVQQRHRMREGGDIGADLTE